MEFKSWNSYYHFAQKTKYGRRYVHDNEVKEFLDTVLITSKQRERPILKDRVFFRAQLGNEWVEIKQNGEVFEEPCPLSKERMKPLPNIAAEGRVNPKGIPYLYLANEKETAMAEVRPWVGSYISVGLFKTVKALKIIDCSVHHNKSLTFYLEEPKPEEREQAAWRDIDRAFSIPVTNNDNVADYVPTQILAELFKANGYDGILYKSSLVVNGYNVALFDLNAAELMNHRSLCQAEEISFIFRDIPHQFITG